MRPLLETTPSKREIFSFARHFQNHRKPSYKILDPNGRFISVWNRVFLAFCLSALFVDPLYFYIPITTEERLCIGTDIKLFWPLFALRTLADLTFLIHICLKFRTAYILPGSRKMGRGILVEDPGEIRRHYLKGDFIIDLAAMLPLPQIMIIIPKIVNRGVEDPYTAITLLVLIQYVPRLFLIFPLERRIIKNTGVVTKTAWAGAAYNLLLYLLASHVLGASWYLISIERRRACWHSECSKIASLCDTSHLCPKDKLPLLNSTTVLVNCDATNEDISFKYGIFADALISGVHSSRFSDKYLYCLWWGLKSLSSYGQNLTTSRYIPETAFCVIICIGGLVLFGHLIGNIQTYLQSMTIRLEEWRVKKRDTEEWMMHRQLPPGIQERVHQFLQYKWISTRGVNEAVILQALPLDLRREIQRHLCLYLVRRVPFFSKMDSQLLDAICTRLVSSLSTEGASIVREGDPVVEMLFIVKGQLESSTTDGGRSGFFHSMVLKPGDFCGEELLTWALMPTPGQNLPSSTRTVKALCEIEAFALKADDLKYVANQFKRLHSKKLQHAFRYYSHQWRYWGACYIQTAWRRFKKRKLAEELSRRENLYYIPEENEPMEADYEETGAEMDSGYKKNDGAESSSVDNPEQSQHFGATVLASKFAANTKKVVQKKVKVIGPDKDTGVGMKLLKPEDPYSFTEGGIE